MAELGYHDGQNMAIEWRFAEGSADRRSELAAELAALRVEVIVAAEISAAVAARGASATIPIVLANGDVVSSGLIASLARPGGNVTGVSSSSVETAGKRVELLRETVPSVSRVAILTQPGFGTNDAQVRESLHAAAVLGLRVQVFPLSGVEDFERAFADIVNAGFEALVITASSVFSIYRVELAEYALRRRLPSIWTTTESVRVGGLMSYGPNIAALYHRAATYVDKILRGASPSDLPVELPSVFDFGLNLQTAGALGLSIPSKILLQATEVIQ
jgi:putative ABC transport system substrate-binding protein